MRMTASAFLLSLLLLLSPGTAAAQEPAAVPHSVAGREYPAFEAQHEWWGFGHPESVQEWELDGGRTIGIYEYHGGGPLLNRLLVLTIPQEDGEHPRRIAFGIASNIRGPLSCLCRSRAEFVSLEPTGDGLLELVMTTTWENQRAHLKHEACGEMCTERVARTLVSLVGIGPADTLDCLACEIPVHVIREVLVPDDGVLKPAARSEAALELSLNGRILTVTPGEGEPDEEQLSWHGTFPL